MLVLHNGAPVVAMSPPTVTQSWPKKMRLNAELIPITAVPPAPASCILHPPSAIRHPASSILDHLDQRTSTLIGLASNLAANARSAVNKSRRTR